MVIAAVSQRSIGPVAEPLLLAGQCPAFAQECRVQRVEGGSRGSRERLVVRHRIDARLQQFTAQYDEDLKANTRPAWTAEQK
jgi:hypothetical protein